MTDKDGPPKVCVGWDDRPPRGVLMFIPVRGAGKARHVATRPKRGAAGLARRARCESAYEDYRRAKEAVRRPSDSDTVWSLFFAWLALEIPEW